MGPKAKVAFQSTIKAVCRGRRQRRGNEMRGTGQIICAVVSRTDLRFSASRF